jgi:nitrite reductase (NO-forming)
MPLVFGWAVQVLVGAWTHLLPAVGVTAPAPRAAMRARLGRVATPRLVAWNLGVLVAWIGLAVDVLPVALAGIAGFSLAALGAVALALSSLLRDRR